MLRLHETNRRLVCRIAVVVLCALPTLGALGWIAARRWPGQAAAAAAELRQQLGLSVAVAGVSYPRPGVVLYQGIELADPETGLPIARCRVLEAARGGATVVLRISQAEIESARASRLWDLLSRQLRRELPGADVQVRFSAGELTWHVGQDASQTFTDLSGRLGPTTAGQELELSFRVAGTVMPEAAALRITRHRPEHAAGDEAPSSSPATSLALHTGGAALPCSVFAPLVEGHRWFGPRARFRGYLWAKDTPQGWEGEVTGQLTEIDLDTLVTSRFPHTLSGACEAQIEQARFVSGRLIEASGTLAAGPGVVSRSLVAAAGEHLHLGTAAPAADPVLYQRLALGFVIDGQGLRITALPASQPRGAILISAADAASERVLWQQPAAGPQPLVGLVRALVPANEVQVPAAPQAEWLIGHLPLPPVVRLPSVEGSLPPKARLRIGATPLDTR